MHPTIFFCFCFYVRSELLIRFANLELGTKYFGPSFANHEWSQLNQII